MNDKQIRPLILVRGFGGMNISETQTNPYQGFNDGTVYPRKRGDNYIYEGFILRALKSLDYPYRDATNVVGYYRNTGPFPNDFSKYVDQDPVSGDIVVDRSIEEKILSHGTSGTIWVYRYYDLRPRSLEKYGWGLARLINLIEQSTELHGEKFRGVDIVAHSMGGLVTRECIFALDTSEKGSAKQKVHRIVTLGTPHRGIAFQRIPPLLLQAQPLIARALRVLKGANDNDEETTEDDDARNELESFDPHQISFRRWEKAFDIRRILTVVGTNFESYKEHLSSALNQFDSAFDEGRLESNRSDGLVKQASAQLPGAPRTFVHKCHGGTDSLVTSREAYEISMRFFHGTHRVSLSLDEAKIIRGGSWRFDGRREFYFGVSVKPRNIDFDLFAQTPWAQNCYGPFHTQDLSDKLPDLQKELTKPLAEFGDDTTGWAGPNRLIWESWVDAGATQGDAQGIVFRVDFYMGERDASGGGYSDNVLFRQQYFVQAFPGKQPALFIHMDEKHLGTHDAPGEAELRSLATSNDSGVTQAQMVKGAPSTWSFDIKGLEFAATLNIHIEPDTDD